MRVCSLASSSKGNCNIVYTDTEILVVDMGISLKELEEKFYRLNLDPNNIIGVLVSHEHSDHTKGILSLVRKYNVPVIYDMDLGHIAESVPLINGAFAKVSTNGNKITINMELK